MKREILLNNQKIDYHLRKSTRASRLRLTVRSGGCLTVTAPYFIKLSIIEEFIREKASWILEKIGLMKGKKHAGIFYKRSNNEYLRLKKDALNIAKQKIEKFNSVYKFSYNNIFIRNQKSRWGSCSQKGNLNFNYKIAFLPENCVDYIIVHELCHLGEFNHSKQFWNLVSKAIPDYKEIRKEIRLL
jgi:predicted metal-dependent hydrolase